MVERDHADARARRSRAGAVPLSHLTAGSVARLQAAEVGEGDSALLRALGLTARSLIRVCKSGDPYIVEVRTTRIGLARTVAEQILVVPESK